MAKLVASSGTAVLVALITVAATAWLVAVVVADVRRAPDADCLRVDLALMDLIASRPVADPIEPVDAVAVHAPWNRSGGSVPFDNYYAIGMKFRKSDGSTSYGVWGLGTDAAPAEGKPLTTSAGGAFGAQLVSVDHSARQSTVWPDTEMFFPEDANAVEKAEQCLTSRQ